MFRVSLALMALSLLSACASSFKQTEALLKAPIDIPRQARLADVHFVNQPEGHCGPATLTMAMLSTGREVTLNQITPMVYTPKEKGSLQNDMLSASRRLGMMAIPIEGLEGIAREVSAGHPVIVFQNLALKWYPKWHYALVTGYDLDREKLILHTGPDAHREMALHRFEETWQRAGQWAVVILPPGQMAPSASELSHLKAASGLEQAAQVEAAETAYKAMLTRWPDSLGALIGLGNISFTRGDRKAAIRYLERAVQAHPHSTVAKHNLDVARESSKR